MRTLLFFGVIALATLEMGCGARTDIDVSPSVDQDAAADAAGLDAYDASDAQVVDVIVTDAGCKADVQCDDLIACTVDRCDPNLRVCTHLPRPALCDDAVFCNGAEACDAVQGCIATGPPSCSDGVACSVDACNEGAKGCDHIPDDSLCPISHACDLQLGCQARALAHSSSTLYDIRLPSGQIKALGGTTAQLTDIALHPTNVLYGIGFNQIYTVNQKTGATTFFKSTNAGSINGADVSPSGTLYVSGGTSL
ncbi:hypothetical protein BH09MYX1_BH09MYX1_48060 [soil metagenome]